MKMKNNHLIAVGSTVAVLLSAGCAQQTTYVDANDTTVAVLDKNKLSSADWIVATEKLCTKLLESEEFNAYLQDYATDAMEKLTEADANGEKITAREKRTATRPLLMLSDIENKTTEHIESQLLTERLRAMLFNSGKVRFTTAVAGKGQRVDQATRQARELRTDPMFKKSTVRKNNEVNAYDLHLGGTIIKQETTAGRKHEISYMFSLQLTDTVTGEGVWAEHIEVKRQDTKGAFGY